jgi:Bacterial Ig-like domain
MNTKSMRYLILGGLLTMVSACGGGSGGGGSGNTNPAPPPPPPPLSFNPVFSEIQSNVFTPTCATSGCHTGASAPQGLRLDAANSYGLLVGVASSQVPSVLRVAAGNPGNSYLIQKLEGTAAAGARMPLNRTPLAQSTINIIRQWITDGAIDDRVPAATPARVTSLSPVPGSDLSAAPGSVVAMFDRALDASTVNTNTFLLEASGGDTTFGDGNETQITAAAITVSANGMTATFDLSGVAMADDTYRVRLLGSGASLVMDLDANALDGEFSGTFPSGNGTAGGDFAATFSITTPGSSGPTLDELQASVFTPTCATSGCHSGPSGGPLPTGMDLTSADASFANLVGVASTQSPGLSRVAAGDPDNSYLVHKIEGTASSGARMPFGGPPLSQALIDDIRQWIADGAAR